MTPTSASSKTKPHQKTIIIGLSGPSSSGKTTLARLLREIYNCKSEDEENSISLSIIHEDDFYKKDDEIPIITTPSSRQLQDWDCAESLSLPLLSSTLQHIYHTGTLPSDLHSKEDLNTVPTLTLPPTLLPTLQSRAKTFLRSLPTPLHLTIFILDGFLLYPPPATQPAIHTTILPYLHLRLFLRSSRTQTLTRRKARSGYVTLDGFWEDPEGYVEEVVWPNYVRDHAWMFADGDVEYGALRKEVETEFGVQVGPWRRVGNGQGDGEGEGDVKMEELLSWAVERVEEGVERILKQEMGSRERK